MKEFIIPEGYVLDEATATENYGSFTIAPFERGFGYTLGNSLRRILLSSVAGAAVSGIKISGVQHEFSSIFGVKEDVVEIILNFKKLRFSLANDEKVILSLNTSSKGAVTGKDIELVAGVELANPEAYLFTQDKPKKMTVEIEVTKGIGFLPVEARSQSVDVGFIPLDADYSPVKKVSYTVENTRVKRVTNFDKLILEIKTDGTVSPEDALKKSASILRKCAEVFVKPAEQEEEALSGMAAANTDALEQSIEVLGVSTRILNSLRTKKISVVKELLKYSEKEFGTFPNFGPKSLTELKKALKEFAKKEGIEVSLK
ncbi:MAG: DNA-directed RNA polymerase subunit alpha [Elusimicrobia bacterium CG_4_10_14_3_um_filter_49_12_50_7]|nr:MAG: DNA-directed RNA polymerase subunit alpha [Elusimicrobia bacterium CG_4_8_14_3_um_filter_50_9]PIY15792.1 MAG: DNA-directed RNA polymerase subunit alpha [Elusimicrobia bacterium CG_4_10_14_3_um_filter_49_12_50_7]